MARGAAPVLNLENATIRRGHRTLVHGASLQVGAGEFVALVGPNGAGKSTLLRAITGEWQASGLIELFGRILSRWRRADLARRLAVMPQSSSLAFDFSVEEVVRLGRLPHRGEGAIADVDVVESVLAALRLDAYRHRRYTTLSGGERQRVQFARVLAQIWERGADGALLLDEPTSALDLAQQKIVLDIARARADSGTAVVAVMHDLNMAVRYASRLVMMREGRIVEDGAALSVLTPEKVDRVFDVDAQIETAGCDGRPIVLLARGPTAAPEETATDGQGFAGPVRDGNAGAPE